MNNYLGEEVVDVKNTEYRNYNSTDWALLYIEKYGGIDGAHHKDWVLDQVARILNDANVVVRIARWSGGTEEYRFNVEATQPYFEWVAKIRAGEDGPETYGYEVGIAP